MDWLDRFCDYSLRNALLQQKWDKNMQFLNSNFPANIDENQNLDLLNTCVKLGLGGPVFSTLSHVMISTRTKALYSTMVLFLMFYRKNGYIIGI